VAGQKAVRVHLCRKVLCALLHALARPGCLPRRPRHRPVSLLALGGAVRQGVAASTRLELRDLRRVRHARLERHERRHHGLRVAAAGAEPPCPQPWRRGPSRKLHSHNALAAPTAGYRQQTKWAGGIAGVSGKWWAWRPLITVGVIATLQPRRLLSEH